MGFLSISLYLSLIIFRRMEHVYMLYTPPFNIPCLVLFFCVRVCAYVYMTRTGMSCSSE